MELREIFVIMMCDHVATLALITDFLQILSFLSMLNMWRSKI